MSNPTYRGPKIRALNVIAAFIKEHTLEEEPRSVAWYKGAAMVLLDQLHVAGLTVADEVDVLPYPDKDV